MDTHEFEHQLINLSKADFLDLAERLDLRTGTVAGEVEWWETTMAIQRVIKSIGCSRTAARAAHQVCAIVRSAAERSGFELPDDRVTRVARAAADVARGLAAGEPAHGLTERLLQAWEPIMAPTAA